MLFLLLLSTVGTGVVITRSFFKIEKQKHLTHTVARSSLTVSVTEQGTLESSNNTEITCKVRGFNTVTWVVPGGTIVEPGDELVKLDTKVVEEAYSLTKTNTHIATATLERSKADVAKAEIAIDAYLQGRYRTQKKTLENQLDVAKRNLANAKTMLANSEKLFEKGFVTELEVEGNAFTVQQAELELKVKETEIDVLDRFTKKMELETLKGNLTASRSKREADEAGLTMEKARRTRAAEELAACVIKAERRGLVIYSSAAAWKNTPDIAQGATVRKDQVLLLMPDLSQMQIKVGIHESMIRRIRPGLVAKVTLPDRVLEANVSSVASVTRPAGWWTGNVVKYDTVIQLPSVEGLKPGMSAEVEVIMAVHTDVLTVPVSAVIETDDGAFCWIRTDDRPKRRSVQLGDTNDVFIVAEAGLKAGDEVILNPLAFVEEAQTKAAETLNQSARNQSEENGYSLSASDSATAAQTEQRKATKLNATELNATELNAAGQTDAN
jgi:multidrug resistance efflux pump